MQGQQAPQVLTEKGSKRDFAMAGLLLGAGQRVGALGGLSHFVVTSVLRGRCYNLHLTNQEAEIRDTK